MSHLESLFGEKLPLPELWPRFFLRKRKSLTHYAVAMQNLWRRLEKRNISSCASITDSDHILRDQIITSMKAGPVQRALQENVKVQPTISFHNAVVACKQKETDAKVAVTKKFKPANLKEDTLVPSPLSPLLAMQT